jgi:uncharacterized membrane protein
VTALLAFSDYWWDWGNLLLRFLHVIAAMAWIGASFYFIALDHHLSPPADARDGERGVGGEAWEIHGGGFYRVEKYRVAPETLPEPLYWFKWEAYTTWLSGFALLVVVYFVHPATYLVDPTVAGLANWEAIAIATAGLLVGWVVYDGLCRVLGGNEWALAVGLVAFVALVAWGASELLAPRAAYLEVGAILGTLMAGNVFFVIIPAHWQLVRAKQEGREPDPRWNARAKQRSVHNNYLTLPVVFAMISIHFPFTYGHDDAWVVLVVLVALGAWTRHSFNLRHQGRNAWWVLASAAAGVAVVAVLIRPSSDPPGHAMGPVPTFTEVQAIVEERCVPCHATNPTLVEAAGAGILLETREQIEDRAERIKVVTVDTRAMPLGNVTDMTDDERDVLARWLASR